MKLLSAVYFIIFVIEILYIHIYLNNWITYAKIDLDKNIEFNLSHKSELDKYFSNVIDERINLLKTMKYKDWLVYNIKNKYINFQGKQYNLFIWERNKIDEYNQEDTSNFTVRCSTHEEFIDMDFNNVVSILNYNFLYGVYKPSVEIPNNLWDLSGLYDSQTNITNIFWVTEDFESPVERSVIFNKYKKRHDIQDKDYQKIEFEGVIGIGYEIRNLNLQYGKVYYEFLGWWFFLIVSILSFFMSIFLYYSSSQENKSEKPILFLFIVNFYLLYFLSCRGGLTSTESEINKMTDINSGIMAISFLVAVNIFIVQTLRGDKKTKYGVLHSESAILFCISLILLLLASAKKTNFINIQELRIHNISSQFFFNMSILINLIVFLNYVIYVASNSKQLKFLAFL